MLAYDHVVGADPDVHRGWRGPYDVSTTFHEPFVLFGYLAAVTSLRLVTDIIILPSARRGPGGQAGSGGRSAHRRTLSVGRRHRMERGRVQALGKDFSNRGARLEQVALLRRLWTERAVTHEGVHERVTGKGWRPSRATPDPGLVQGGGRRACGASGGSPTGVGSLRFRPAPSSTSARDRERRGCRRRAAIDSLGWRAGSAGRRATSTAGPAGRPVAGPDATAPLPSNTMAAGLGFAVDGSPAAAGQKPRTRSLRSTSDGSRIRSVPAHERIQGPRVAARRHLQAPEPTGHESVVDPRVSSSITTSLGRADVQPRHCAPGAAWPRSSCSPMTIEVDGRLWTLSVRGDRRTSTLDVEVGWRGPSRLVGGPGLDGLVHDRRRSWACGRAAGSINQRAGSEAQMVARAAGGARLRPADLRAGLR